MTPDRTELEWIYEPIDFFEATYCHTTPGFELVIEAGRALATVTTPISPLPKSLEDNVTALVNAIFLLRQSQIHRNYKLDGPRIYQHFAGRKDVFVHLSAGVFATSCVGRCDMIVRDATGKIVGDSKAERVAQDKSELDLISLKLARSPTLLSMLESYSRAVADPANELHYLYEIREALVRYFGGQPLAINAIGTSKQKWQWFGKLANVEPLEEGRHRGKHPAGLRRPATTAELDQARRMAHDWIVKFAEVGSGEL